MKDAYSVNSKGQLFLYHTLPTLTSVSPSVGGHLGGTRITVKGNSFDKLPGKTKVKVGSSECNIVSIDNEELVCETPAADQVAYYTYTPPYWCKTIFLDGWSSGWGWRSRASL